MTKPSKALEAIAKLNQSGITIVDTLTNTHPEHVLVAIRVPKEGGELPVGDLGINQRGVQYIIGPTNDQQILGGLYERRSLTVPDVLTCDTQYFFISGDGVFVLHKRKSTLPQELGFEQVDYRKE